MPGFLSPILTGDPGRHVLRNVNRETLVAEHLLAAFDSTSRNTGLLAHDSMPEMTALVIAPTFAIHTFFMKFPIDVVFVAKDGRVVKARSAIRPWRLAAAPGAYAAIELPAGSIERSGTCANDRLTFEARPI